MGLFSGIKKAFKKVFKIVKKVAPIALMVGAIVFTGGAALGLAPLGIAGGWGGAMAALTSSIGMTGAGASILTGALTHAGFGAAIGAAGAAVTGGNIIKGAGMGAAAGAVTGGLSGAMGGFGAAGSSATGLGNPADVAAGMTAPAQAASVAPQVATAGPAVAGAASNGPAGGFGAFLNNNSNLVGQAVQGIGSGLAQGMQNKEDRRAREERRESYEFGMGQYQSQPYDASGNPTPTERYSGGQRQGAARRRYQWNRESGRIERN